MLDAGCWFTPAGRRAWHKAKSVPRFRLRGRKHGLPAYLSTGRPCSICQPGPAPQAENYAAPLRSTTQTPSHAL
ncbi:hypothetical protein L665_00035 [Ralstonia solanacearum SD54]|nr:Type IV pilus response regulator PilG [Ralstonia solanacearum]ESS51956.1 hypothetical protein L665_00035 [Ralstonia solanacearum SD54]